MLSKQNWLTPIQQIGSLFTLRNGVSLRGPARVYDFKVNAWAHGARA